MGKLTDTIFFRNRHTCPWWICFTFDNPLRRLVQNPEKIMGRYIKAGMSILDIGPGQGYFSFPLAALTGENGKVTCLDIQKEMLDIIRKKILKKGVINISTKTYNGENFHLEGNFDFINIFWMFHEVPNKEDILKEIKLVCKKNTVVFFAEPWVHVTGKSFEKSVEMFQSAGFEIIDRPKVFFSRSAVFNI